MARISKLEGRLKKVAARLTKAFEGLVTEIGEAIGEELVPATPVDTGHARANWQPTLNSQAVSPVTRTDPTGSATISRIAVVSRQFKIGDTLYITNNVDYIEKLNEGSSPQAAAGFVGEAVRRGTRIGISRLTRGLLR